MGVITGLRGLVNGVSRFQEFSVTSTVDLKEIFDAGTIGSRKRIPGTRGWDGTYTSGGVVADYIAGDIVSFLGSIDGAVGLSGQGLITQTVITIPVSDNDPITHENTLYGLDDIVAGPAVVAEPDPPIPPDMPKGICVELAPPAAVPSFTQEENTTNIVITLTVDPAEYIDCGTDGNRNAIEGPWDAQVDYDRNVDDFSLLPDRDSAFILRVATSDAAAQFYTFEYMRPNEWSNMAVNRDGTLVSASVPMMYSAYEDVAGTQTKGKVTLPSGGTWQPQAMAAGLSGLIVPPSGIQIPEGNRLWRPQSHAEVLSARLNRYDTIKAIIDIELEDTPDTDEFKAHRDILIRKGESIEERKEGLLRAIQDFVERMSVDPSIPA